ncbi:MAG: EFR1 family ferrodoxin [Spirochaetales bacterium]|nr:EFR1 family ferrodoxin [Spirochaetales bacterium]
MNKMHLLYFSGTGNSLHITNELLKLFPGSEAVPVVGLLQSGIKVVEGESIGFVFPIYAFSVPEPVRQLIIRISFPSAKYFFAVTSRHCSANVFKLLNRLLLKKGGQLNAGFSLQAPENYIQTFAAPTQGDVKNFDEELQLKLMEMKAVINNREDNHPKDPLLLSLFANTLFPFMTFLHNAFNYFNIYNTFYTDEKCNSCGQCEKICLSGRISIANGTPVWNRKIQCYYCLACLQYCPRQAIQLKVGRTKTKGRYHYPGIGARDIAAQKPGG